MAIIVNGDGILTGVSSLATALTDLTSGRGTVTGVATVGTLQLGAGVSMGSPRTQNAAIFTNNTEFLTVDDAGRIGIGTISPNTDAHPQNVGKINVGFVTARSIAGDIDANTMVVAGISTFVGAVNVTNLATFSKSGSALKLNDGSILRLGNDDSDFFLYHDGSTTDYISAGASRQLRLTTDDFIIKGASNTETLMTATKDGNVVLYHDNTGRVNTDSTGITVTNRITGGGDANTYINVGPNDIIDLYTGGTNLIRMNANGRLGINEASPSCKLDIEDGASGGDGITEILRLNGSPNDTNDGIKVNFARAGSSCGSIVLEKVASNNTTDLIISTRSSNTVSESVRITGSGLVGIGTDAPENDLHIMDGSATMKLTSTTSANSTRLILESESDSYGGVHFGDPSDEDAGRIRYYHGGSYPNSMRFATDAADRMMIHSGGVVSFNSGIELGSGLDATAANTLDDYEEGTFTFSLGHSLTPTETDGTYTKIGNFCIAAGSITFPSTADGNHAILGGLPFTAAGGRPGAAIVRYSNDNEAYKIAWHVNAGAASASPYYSDGGGTTANVYFSTKRLDLVFCYRTA